LKLYIELLPGEYTFDESLKYLKELIDNTITLEDDTVQLLVKKYEDGLSFGILSDEDKSIILRIKKIKKMRNINTYPDITGLADFTFWLKQNGEDSLPVSEVLKEMPGVDALDSKNYQEYITLCLPGLIAHSESPEDHKLIIRSLSREGLDMEFYSLYFKSMGELLSVDKDRGFKALLQFQFCYFYYYEAKLRVLGEESTTSLIRELTMGVFSNRPYAFIKEFDRCINMEFMFLRRLCVCYQPWQA
jgi:hypothetical protein